MRILITGATGLVGQGVLDECLRDPQVTGVVALGRRPSGRTDAKLRELSCPDFTDLDAVEPELHGFDACLYCAGAQAIGASEADYRHVTLALTTHAAAVLAGIDRRLLFVYVSGAGSNPASRLMPLRVKGETEHALQALPLRSVMLRPGVVQPVHGVRSPHRLLAAAYKVAAPLMGVGVGMLPGMVTSTARVGRAMLQLARQQAPPPIVENAEINRLGA